MDDKEKRALAREKKAKQRADDRKQRQKAIKSAKLPERHSREAPTGALGASGGWVRNIQGRVDTGTRSKGETDE